MIAAYCLYYSPGSWAIHARNFFNALSHYDDVLVVPWDKSHRTFLLSSGIPKCTDDISDSIAVELSIGIGPIQRMNLMKSPRRIGYVVWETTRIPAEYCQVLLQLDELWTPSVWGAQILVANGIPEHKIRVVPEGVDSELYKPSLRPNNTERRFRFLCVGKWEERKGIRELVMAFSKEFKPSEPVELVVHCSSPVLPTRELHKNILQIAGATHAPIRTSEPLSEIKMPILYNSCDAFILPTRGEGFGLSIFEALACGLPVIVTAYSAPFEYLTDSVAYFIRVESLVDVYDPIYFPTRGIYGKWAQPDVMHIRTLMRHVFENTREAKEKGLLGRNLVSSRWTWKHVADIAYEFLRPMSGK